MMNPMKIKLHRVLPFFPALCLLTGSAFAQTTLLDNFNTDTTGSAPAGWTTVTTGGTVSVQNSPSLTDQSTSLAKTGSANSVSATRTFATTSGKVAVELKVY